MLQSKRKKGFTLIELLVVVTIITVLVTIGIVAYSSINKRSRDAKRKSDLEQVRSALEMFRSDFGYYPDTGLGNWTLTSDLSTVLVATYMPAIPGDPSTGTYKYKPTAKSGTSYYGYCICGNLETGGGTNLCSSVTTLPIDCNYGLKSP
ncbi:prepilin-type N-terminal cleavage/methylation domain-containing protein [Patescibacteria group bacterium]|nr:prepilin-type N-terminal cleavage/methylation domain-containing protein [Patescibacteria group bacterium]MBU1472431.1 prepilin-type N-terminal cleavage/methylation domain-containing protein [Patescibacteria group bacterium]MBU2460246.1 prepilin-type N-terminal cleavage/methylation domain-containing protein [Patescibacteria group bacterium]MBU2544549.1 prepilin-type N-terminal cleavage/methylation domain-containing protein [Patescibacteria group bacterium]